MTRQKLTDAVRAGGGGDSGNGSGPMRPGESMTFHAKDKAGNILKTYTLTRTDRPYAYDLRDAYNDQLTRDDVIYIVTDGGSVKLVDDPHWTIRRTRELAEHAERDRRQFIHRQKYPINEEK